MSTPLSMAATPAAARHWSSGLDRSMAVRLFRRFGVAHDVVDSSTVRFLAVPVSEEFNKPRTNLLLRSAPELSVAAFVDADLNYRGEDASLRAAFCGAVHNHWRPLRLPALPPNVNEALSSLLRVLGSPLAQTVRDLLDRRNKRGQPLPVGRMLAAVGRPVSAAAAQHAFSTSVRQQLAGELAVITTRSALPRSAFVWGRPGAGGDDLLLAALHPLLQGQLPADVWDVSAARLAASCFAPGERDAALMALIVDATAVAGRLLLIHDFDVCLTGSPVCYALLCEGLDRGLRFLATVRDPAFLKDVREDEALARRVAVVRIPPPTVEQTLVAARHFVAEAPIAVADSALEAALRLTQLEEWSQPAATLAQLSAALADSAWQGRPQVSPDDVYAVPKNQWPD